jgi:GDP-mannose 6-dehydrogenase
VSAACLARDGNKVIGVDVDPAKVAEINRGESPIMEAGLAELIRNGISCGQLRATMDVEHAVRESDIALITVGTPSAEDGSISLQSIINVIQGIGIALRRSVRDYTVVVRSTLIPGLLEQEVAPLLEQASGRKLGNGLWLCNNPEFLREGTAIRDYDHPPFVIVGSSDAAPARDVLELYKQVEAEQIVTDTRTAALVKYACNAFHAVKVAFANEVGCLAKSFGADGHQVMAMLCRDRKLNLSPAYLKPGFAFGGSCLPKDLRALARHSEQRALRLNLLESILPSNDAHIGRTVALVQKSGHRRIGIVGLSFKAGTDDLRESPVVRLVETLLGRGYDLRIFDPSVSVSRLRGRNLAYIDRHLPHLASLLVGEIDELFDHATCLVLATDVAADVPAGRFAGSVIDLRSDLAKPASPVAAPDVGEVAAAAAVAVG